MTELEKLIEGIAGDLMIADTEDLPSMAKIHEGFLEVAKSVDNESELLLKATQKCADLIGKTILNEIGDKDAVIPLIKESVSVMQSIINNDYDESKAKFPAKLGLYGDDEKQNESSSEAEGDSPGEESYIVEFEGADSSLLGDFINEAREHCLSAEEMLMNLETGEDRDTAINSIFRSFHTIKGASGFLELTPVLVVAHESETLLDLGRKGEVKIEGKAADICFDSIDVIRKLLDGIEEALAQGGSFDGTATIKHILETLREFLKDPQKAFDEKPGDRVGDKLTDMGVVSQERINDALANKEHEDEKIGETLVKQNVVPAKTIAHALRDQQRVKKEKFATTVKEIVKIETERLDKLVDTIGELVIAESMVGQDEEILAQVSHKTARNISHLDKITRELQEMGMAMRLVPVKGTFQKLARAVRDLTRKSGKKADLKISGEDTEVDRSIAERIGDPLMHMIRNAVDHGIEDPETRIQAGKPETGTVKLRAFHKGGNIYFEIEDDGKGLNKERILTKAIERNLIDPNKELTEKEMYNLVLLPGFSTAKEITDVSGRGVGMDVVRKNIDSMRGQLEITSKANEGTSFSMKLPLTLAIIDGMLISVGNEKYIIPTLSVVESLSLSNEMISTVTEKGELINLRGELLPLIRINRLFKIHEGDTEFANSTVVVVEENARKVGLVVDKLLGQRQTVIKSLGQTFANQKWISGGAILSNGNIGLILDINGIVNLAGEIGAEMTNIKEENRNSDTKMNEESSVDGGQVINEVEKNMLGDQPEEVSQENKMKEITQPIG